MLAKSIRNCLSITPNTAGANPRASVIAKGVDVYFIDGDTKLQAYSFSSSIALGTTWATKSGYTAPTIGAATLGLGFSDSGYVVGAAGYSAYGASGSSDAISSIILGKSLRATVSMSPFLRHPLTSCFTGAKQLPKRTDLVPDPGVTSLAIVREVTSKELTVASCLVGFLVQ